MVSTEAVLAASSAAAWPARPRAAARIHAESCFIGVNPRTWPSSGGGKEGKQPQRHEEPQRDHKGRQRKGRLGPALSLPSVSSLCSFVLLRVFVVLLIAETQINSRTGSRSS